MAPELLLARPDATCHGGQGALLRRDTDREHRAPYTAAVDVWALGVLVSELLAGTGPAGRARSPSSVADAILGGPEVVLPSGCSTDVVDFLSSCFETDPHMRPSGEMLAGKVSNMDCRLTALCRPSAASVDSVSPVSSPQPGSSSTTRGSAPMWTGTPGAPCTPASSCT